MGESRITGPAIPHLVTQLVQKCNHPFECFTPFSLLATGNRIGNQANWLSLAGFAGNFNPKLRLHCYQGYHVKEVRLHGCMDPTVLSESGRFYCP